MDKGFFIFLIRQGKGFENTNSQQNFQKPGQIDIECYNQQLGVGGCYASVRRRTLDKRYRVGDNHDHGHDDVHGHDDEHCLGYDDDHG